MCAYMLKIRKSFFDGNYGDHVCVHVPQTGHAGPLHAIWMSWYGTFGM